MGESLKPEATIPCSPGRAFIRSSYRASLPGTGRPLKRTARCRKTPWTNSIGQSCHDNLLPIHRHRLFRGVDADHQPKGPARLSGRGRRDGGKFIFVRKKKGPQALLFSTPDNVRLGSLADIKRPLPKCPLSGVKQTSIIHSHSNNLLQKFLRWLSLCRKATPIPPFVFSEVAL